MLFVRGNAACAAVLPVLLAACTAEIAAPGVESAALDREPATLVFGGDFEERTEGALVAGGVAYLDYDASRLTACRGERYGQPAWSISAHYRIAGGDVRSVHVAGHAAAPDQVGLPITLDRAGELEVWFENNSSFGCQAWDSNLGANYRFTVASDEGGETDSPAAVFGGDWSFAVEGEPQQGQTLAIRYDISRLPQCRDSKYGLPAWSILARYRFPSGRTGYTPVASSGQAVEGAIELTEPGELEIWFENQGYWGCRAYDSRFGQNYRVVVDADARAPGWIGNAAYVINRQTCDGPCDSTRRPLEEVFTHGTYARQRAAIRAIYFDVWKAGVTDFDNANLWRELDVQVHYRWRSTGEYTTRHVPFFRRVGNDARYELPMSVIDPLASGVYPRTERSQCPDAALSVAPDQVYVQATVEYFFTVNGVPLRRADGADFRGVFEDYRNNFEVCLTPQ